MVTQFSINMLVPIGMMTAIGIWLDKKFGTYVWTIVLFLVGAVAGGQNVYRMAKRFTGDTEQNKERKVSDENNGKLKK